MGISVIVILLYTTSCIVIYILICAKNVRDSIPVKEIHGMFDTTTFAENKAIVHVNGKIIGNAVTQFRDEIEQQLQDGNNNLIIDLTDVPLLDSTALGVIIITFQVLQKSGGKLVLLNPQKAVSSVLEVTRLTSILEVYESEAGSTKRIFISNILIGVGTLRVPSLNSSRQSPSAVQNSSRQSPSAVLNSSRQSPSAVSSDKKDDRICTAPKWSVRNARAKNL